MEARGIEIVADVPTENAQADFAADVVKVKNSDAEAIFVYLTEEESARFLREAQKQGVSAAAGRRDDADRPEGHRPRRRRRQRRHGPCRPDARRAEPAGPGDGRRSSRRSSATAPDHNAIKGYIGAYAIKYATEQVGEFDSEKIAEHLHGLKLIASEHPGILIDVSWDDTGEVSRESYLVEVEDGKQVVKATLPAN